MVQTQPTLAINSQREREEYFLELYEETFPKVATFVSRRGGSFEDAKDVFHDSLIILYEKMVSENRIINVSPEFYLVGIAKHLWIRKFKEDSKKLALDDLEKSIAISEDYFEPSESKLATVLELTGRKCLNLLKAFYYDNLPLQQIKDAFGFANVHSASVQKHKCIEKMRNTIQEKSMGYEDFN